MKRLLNLFLAASLIIVFSTTPAFASPYGCGSYGSQTYQDGSCGSTPPSGGGTSGGSSSGNTSSGNTSSDSSSSGSSSLSTKKSSGGSATSTPTGSETVTTPIEETTPTPVNQEPTISIGPVKLPINEKVAVANKKLPITGAQVLGILGVVLVAVAAGMWFWYFRRIHKDDPRKGSGGAPPTILIPPSGA